MIYKCRNCSGNVVYSPERHKMYCPFCEGEDCQEESSAVQTTVVCSNCGGELEIGEFTSASRCPYCDNYLIFDERVTGEYTPGKILPFVYGKEDTKKLMRKKFNSCVFAPASFLSDAKLDSMVGMYVPFWLYDYHARGRFDGEGKKIRTWCSGDREYTETSVYHIVRDMEVDFDKMPVDASDAMPDSVMDLMEPYDYQALEGFQGKYMSGFFAERYNADALSSEPRAVQKASKDAESLLKQSIGGYVGLASANDNNVSLSRTDTTYALLPVWIYHYKFNQQDYRFHINGQTGKIVGKVPIAKGKVWGYGATVFASCFAILMLLRQLLMLL